MAHLRPFKTRRFSGDNQTMNQRRKLLAALAAAALAAPSAVLAQGRRRPDRHRAVRTALGFEQGPRHRHPQRRARLLQARERRRRRQRAQDRARLARRRERHQARRGQHQAAARAEQPDRDLRLRQRDAQPPRAAARRSGEGPVRGAVHRRGPDAQVQPLRVQPPGELRRRAGEDRRALHHLRREALRGALLRRRGRQGELRRGGACAQGAQSGAGGDCRRHPHADRLREGARRSSGSRPPTWSS